MTPDAIWKAIRAVNASGRGRMHWTVYTLTVVEGMAESDVAAALNGGGIATPGRAERWTREIVRREVSLARRALRAALDLPDPRQHDDRNPRFSSTAAQRRRMRQESNALDAAVAKAYEEAGCP